VAFAFEFQFQNRKERRIRGVPAWNQLNHVLCFWAASLEAIFPPKRPAIRMISCLLWPQIRSSSMKFTASQQIRQHEYRNNIFIIWIELKTI
jgi:hypothetical protein